MKKIKDHYFHKAKKDGYAARSAYKIEEIETKRDYIPTENFSFIKPISKYSNEIN